MKKVLILFLAIMFMVPSYSQEKSEKKSGTKSEKNVLKVNSFSLFLATGSLFYERKLSDGVSGQLGLSYLGVKIQDTKFTGLVLTPEVRFYPKKNAIDGFYIAPYLRYRNYTLQNGANKGSFRSMGGGLLFGRQWITRSGFTMDLFFGGHYGSSNLKVVSGTDNFNANLISSVGMRVGFAIGFAF
jgi:hypothetical protein